SAAVQVKRQKPEASLRVINKGKIISYGACGIPYALSGEISSPQKLIHFTPESFEKMRGVAVETGREAVALDPGDRVIEVKNLESGEILREEYEKLLIATGAAPLLLSCLDYQEEGIFSVHAIDDLTRILRFLENRGPHQAAIIGAGNIGLEVAEALKTRGMEVAMVELYPDPARFWPPLIRKAVLEKLEEKGVRFFPNTEVKSVTRTRSGFLLEGEGKSLEADVVFCVIGTAPATQFCRGKLEMEKNGAIKIDQRGRTSAPEIYAAGDCATTYHKILRRDVYLPLGSTANKMGRIAGINMAGGNVPFPGIVGTQIMKFFELSLAKTGLSLEDAQREGIAAKAFVSKRLDKAGYYPGAAMAKVEVVIEEASRKTIGASVVCEGNAAQFIDPAAVAVFMGMSVDDLGWFDSAYAPPFAPVWNALISAALKATSED
ncbi:MAG: FAD-dependent oxidoreductase, partial [Acidobacteriota bacterium]